ncbi:MAG: phasin family protein [Pseudomonadota bacterium]|nr:phasin family protein [Pseudomonadota bacterium]
MKTIATLVFMNFFNGWQLNNSFTSPPCPTLFPAPKETDMNRQLPCPASAGQALGSELASWSLLPDFNRQQLAMATEIACTLFRSSEAMRKIQQEAAHHASLRHEAAMQKLRANCTPVELMAIQTDLLRFDLEKASQYWQQLAALALQTQVEIITTTSHVHDSEAGNSLKSTLSAFQATLPLINGFFPSRASHSIE